ncbi:SAM-dependent methyltransferase [Amycolatopsis sp. PS_44_ISF1]|uniref:SAM-dependent methyltransferase n=1 Tax=Amycolatopsis sp. PS_44_ISF1 TaxID=2974917 RepID=UPI0028DF68AE|nr:SAM-dependent methyltransferase [Amycolatopsis sp. PS_44_ISF1]MDT8909978.1 SAM-dependent methyltransferase [Amycolatopsis sp. PS_44_ISF1]
MTAVPDPEAPEGVDLERPNAARIYDWFLGGNANWAIDREFGERAVKTFPMVKNIARVGREFLGRGVQYLARNGIDQFLDLGSGVPTVGNVHEIAASVNPHARCVYVDNEPVAVAHSQILLEREGVADRHAVIQGDLRHPAEIWPRALDTGVLDPKRPIGLIMVGVLYFLGPDEPTAEIVQKYLSLLPSGSYFLSSHLTGEGVLAPDGESRDRIKEQYKESSTPFHLRTRAEFSEFFAGLELVEPGLVWLPQWHPEEFESKATARMAEDPSFAGSIGALGRKP